MSKPAKQLLGILVGVALFSVNSYAQLAQCQSDVSNLLSQVDGSGSPTVNDNASFVVYLVKNISYNSDTNTCSADMNLTASYGSCLWQPGLIMGTINCA